jgi:OmpA-OmpF porin, OOP family
VVERAAMAQSVGMLKADQMKKEIDAKGRVAVYINFDTDKADIKAESQPVIDEIAKLLQGDGALKLSVEGHTDNTGTAARNQTLSGERAQSVLGAIVGKGIAKERLSAKGFGQDKPLADNASDAGRAKNRRVELVKVTG